MSILSIFKNLQGEWEVGRTMFVAGGSSAIVAPLAFTAVDMHHGAHFDIAAFCIAYPGGLAALNSLNLFSIGKKGKDAAIERQTVAMPPLSDTSTEAK